MPLLVPCSTPSSCLFAATGVMSALDIHPQKLNTRNSGSPHQKSRVPSKEALELLSHTRLEERCCVLRRRVPEALVRALSGVFPVDSGK
mmetsp:Transcript_49982/g.106827  ORF Transcript_49982/g.106827 Transcript_49982/m.106827 type:complete len:89 (+) Transcript_49982:243-509(+)